MTDMNRRKAVQALGAAIAGPITTNYALAQKEKSEIVIGAAMPVTGIFSMAGAFLSAGMSDYIALRNSQGGILGHKIKYVWEDSNFKVEQGVNVFKKMMANEKLSFFYADNTGLCKAIAREALESGTVMTATASCAAVVADPVIRLKVVEVVVMSPPLTAMSPATVSVSVVLLYVSPASPPNVEPPSLNWT